MSTGCRFRIRLVPVFGTVLQSRTIRQAGICMGQAEAPIKWVQSMGMWSRRWESSIVKYSMGGLLPWLGAFAIPGKHLINVS